MFLISFSCAREKEIVPEYINYNSEIFYGNDTLIYGEWEYLHIYRSWAVNEKLNIFPIGNFKRYLDNELFATGKIDTIFRQNHVVKLAFCADGLKPAYQAILNYKNFRFQGPDTLIFYLKGCYDCSDAYYKRIK